MIDKIKHYSLTNPASIYDEEAMTALELAGRTAVKVNECIEHVNAQDAALEKAITETVPVKIEAAVQKHLESGEFDEQIDQYAGGLTNRIDNLFNSMNEGSTTLDAELLDLRLDDNGKSNLSAGLAIRNNFKSLNAKERERFAALGITYFENRATTGVTDTRIMSNAFKPAKATAVNLPADLGYKMTVVTYSDDGHDIASNSGWVTGVYPIATNTYTRIILAHNDESSISPTEFAVLTFEDVPATGVSVSVGGRTYDNEYTDFAELLRYGTVNIGNDGELTHEFNRTRITSDPFRAGLYKVTTSNGIEVKPAIFTYVNDGYTGVASKGWSTVAMVDYQFCLSLSFRKSDDSTITPADLANVKFERLAIPDEAQMPELIASGFYSFNSRTSDGSYLQTDTQYFCNVTNYERPFILESSREFAVRYVYNGTTLYDSGWITGRHTIPCGVSCVIGFKCAFEHIKRYVRVKYPEFDADLTPYLYNVKSYGVTETGYTPSVTRFTSAKITLEKPLYIYNRKGFANITYHIWEGSTKVFDAGWSSSGTIPAGVELSLFFKTENDVAQIWELADICTRPAYVPPRLDGFKSIAHRGLSAQAPENTLAAFKAAKAHGFGYVECDVRISYETNEIYIIHDETLDRTSNGSGDFDGYNMNESTLKSLDFGSWFNEGFAGEKILTLDEFLRWCRDAGLHAYLHIKSDGSDSSFMNNVMNSIRRYQMQDKCSILGGLDVAQFLSNSGQETLTMRFGLVAGNYDDALAGLMTLEYDYSLPNFFITCDYSNFDPTIIENCKSEKRALEIWTVDDATVIENLDPYISGVTSNKILAAEIIERNM